MLKKGVLRKTLYVLYPLFGIFEKRVLEKYLGCNRKQRKMRNTRVNDLYYTPNILRVTKKRRTEGSEHVASMGEKMHTRFWCKNPKERNDAEHLGVNGRIIFKRV